MILVTGGTGMVGAHLLRRLLTDSHEPIRATYRSDETMRHTRKIFAYTDEHVDDAMRRIEWVRADLLDPVDIGHVIGGVKTVYHCAATVSFHPRDARKMLDQNPGMTALLVNAAIEEGVEAFIHVSSVAALGHVSAPEEITERTTWKESSGNSIYARSKYAAELHVWRGMEEGLNAAILNPAVILGPGNWRSGSSKLFHTFYKEFPFYTEGVTGFVDVADVVEALIRLRSMEKFGQRFIAVGENASFKTLFDMICGGYGKKPPHIRPPRLFIELLWRWEHLRSYLTSSEPLVTRETADSAQNTYLYSNEKARRELGMTFTPLRVTVSRYCDLYRSEMEA